MENTWSAEPKVLTYCWPSAESSDRKLRMLGNTTQSRRSSRPSSTLADSFFHFVSNVRDTKRKCKDWVNGALNIRENGIENTRQGLEGWLRWWELCTAFAKYLLGSQHPRQTTFNHLSLQGIWCLWPRGCPHMCTYIPSTLPTHRHMLKNKPLRTSCFYLCIYL